MKKVLILALVAVFIIPFVSCQNRWFESWASLEVINVGDVAVMVYIITYDGETNEVLRIGESAVFDFYWPGFDAIKVLLEVEDLNDGEIYSDTIYLYDGDHEAWDVGFIYSAAGKSSKKIFKFKGKRNIKKDVQ